MLTVVEGSPTLFAKVAGSKLVIRGMGGLVGSVRIKESSVAGGALSVQRAFIVFVRAVEIGGHVASLVPYCVYVNLRSQAL